MQSAIAEQRWSPRRRLSESLTVYLNGHPVAATARDISIGGVLVDTGAIRLPRNSQVYVYFKLSRSGAAAPYRFAARVVRSSERGAGLMFSDFGPRALHNLRELLQVLFPADEAARQQSGP
jgi:hypothetical protein